MMEVSEIMDGLNDLEARFPVDLWSIEGVRIWPLVRRQVYFKLQPVSSSHERKPLIFRIAETIRSRLGLLKSLACLELARFKASKQFSLEGGQQDAVFFNSSRFHDFVGGSWYATHCDPLRDFLEKEGISTLSLVSGWETLEPTYRQSAFVQRDMIFARIRGLARARFKRSEKEHLPGLTEFGRALTPAFSEVFSLEEVRDYFFQIRYMADVLKPILAALKTKIGLSVCYYDTDKMAFNLACRELGIPSVDIQHGIQGDNHVAYGRWNRVPADGYELLPSLFWCWNEVDVQAIQRWSSGAHQAIAGGNLYLREWVSGARFKDVPVHPKIAAIKARRPTAKHVLVALHGETSAEQKSLVEILRASATKIPDVFFWIRLHPLHMERHAGFAESLKRELAAKNFEVETASRVPLPEILREMDLLMTETSSVVIDAEVFRVPVVLTHPWGAVHFPTYVASGWARLACEPDAAVEAISFQLAGRHTLHPPSYGLTGVDARSALITKCKSVRDNMGLQC